VSRILWLLPALSSMLALAWNVHSKWFPWLLAKYVVLLAFAAWFTWRKAAETREHVERLAELDLTFARTKLSEGVRWTLLVGAVIAGTFWSLVRQDARWFLVMGVVVGLLAIGDGLRWLVYDRWVTSQLRQLELLRFRETL